MQMVGDVEERVQEEAIAEEDYQRAADLTEEMKTLRAHVLASIDTRLTENVPVKHSLIGFTRSLE